MIDMESQNGSMLHPVSPKLIHRRYHIQASKNTNSYNADMISIKHKLCRTWTAWLYELYSYTIRFSENKPYISIDGLVDVFICWVLFKWDSSPYDWENRQVTPWDLDGSTRKSVGPSAPWTRPTNGEPPMTTLGFLCSFHDQPARIPAASSHVTWPPGSRFWKVGAFWVASRQPCH